MKIENYCLLALMPNVQFFIFSGELVIIITFVAIAFFLIIENK